MNRLKSRPRRFERWMTTVPDDAIKSAAGWLASKKCCLAHIRQDTTLRSLEHHVMTRHRATRPHHVDAVIRATEMYRKMRANEEDETR